MATEEFRTLARLGGDPGDRGAPGPAGPPGQGTQGIPGVNAVPADTAVGTYAATGSTATYAAIDATWARKGELDPVVSGVVNGFTTAPAIGYGHSFIAGTGLSASQYWASMVAARMGVAYTNRGQGGTLAEDSAWRMWANDSNGFTIGSKATVIIENMLNSLRLNGEDPATWRGVNYSLRTMCALAAAKTLYNAANARLTYSTTGWASYSSGQNTYPGGVYRATASSGGAGAYVEFTTATPANGTQLLTLGRKVGLAQGLTEFRRMDTNTVILLWDNKDNAAAGIAQNYAPVAFSFDVPSGTTIRATNLANGDGGGSTTICGLLERDPDAPNTVILMKEPKLANWAASTMFPNGSDAAVDYFNTIIDNIAASQSNVIAVNPEPWWTKSNAASVVQADEVHPTLEGNRRLRDAALASVSGQALRLTTQKASRLTDTNWENLGQYIAAGFTGTLQGRRKNGDDVCIIGNLTGTVPTGAQQLVVNALPEKWRPITAGAIGPAFYGGSGAHAGVVRELSTGVINATQNSGIDKGSCQFTLTFFSPVS